MLMKQAAQEDFDHAFYFIEKLWDYNTYDKDKTKEVYDEILRDSNSFAFFILNDDGDYCGFVMEAFLIHSGCRERPVIWRALSLMRNIEEKGMAGQ